MKNRTCVNSALAIVLLQWLVAAAPGWADEPSYSDAWGPAVGDQLPLLAAQNQAGVAVQLGDLVGRDGLLLVLVRSADW